MGTNYFWIPSPEARLSAVTDLRSALHDHLRILETDAVSLSGWRESTIYEMVEDIQKLRNTAVHIGKTSHGWQYLIALHPHNGSYLYYDCNFESFCSFLQTGQIITQYGDALSYENFLQKLQAVSGAQHRGTVEWQAERYGYLRKDGYDWCSSPFR